MVIIQMSCGAQRKPRRKAKPLALQAGDRVMRKSDGDSRLAVGEVLWASSTHARIRWPAPQRIGGEFHHSTIKLTNRDVFVATEEQIAERRVDVRLRRVRTEITEALRFCRAGRTDLDDWFKRNRTTPELLLEKYKDRVRAKTRLLIEAGRELGRVRAAARGEDQQTPPPGTASA